MRLHDIAILQKGALFTGLYQRAKPLADLKNVVRLKSAVLEPWQKKIGRHQSNRESRNVVTWLRTAFVAADENFPKIVQ